MLNPTLTFPLYAPFSYYYILIRTRNGQVADTIEKVISLAVLVQFDYRGSLTRLPYPSFRKSSIRPFWFVKVNGRKPATGDLPLIFGMQMT